MGLSIGEYKKKITEGRLDSSTVFDEYQKKITDDSTNSFLSVDEFADEKNKQFSDTLLQGAPIAIKDIFMTQGKTTTCASKMLETYKPPYTATAIQKLQEAGGAIIGKTNMDEFAMGSSGENSAFGATLNPHDTERVAGGSSSGSAAAVANDLCLASLGTDTGGSVRLPAALCGVVGIKPTYARISRYGVQSMASSFDHVGVFSKNVADGALLTGLLSGQDKHDATTQEASNDTAGWLDNLDKDDLNGMSFALPKQFLSEGIDNDCRENCLKVIDTIESLGGEVDEIDLPAIEYGVSIYYILVPAEISTNMQRYDGIRYGHQKDTKEFRNIYEYYAAVRNEGFGEEVKRRILTGTFVLSAGYQDAYYNKALQARKTVQKHCEKIFEAYDAIVGPMSTTPAWKVGAYADDPVKLYMMDKFAVLANIIQAPAMSIPSGYVERGGKQLPVGFQIITKKWDEGSMFRIGATLERAIDFTPLK